MTKSMFGENKYAEAFVARTPAGEAVGMALVSAGFIVHELTPTVLLHLLDLARRPGPLCGLGTA